MSQIMLRLRLIDSVGARLEAISEIDPALLPASVMCKSSKVGGLIERWR